MLKLNQLKNLTTPRLLAYLKRWMQKPEHADWDTMFSNSQLSKDSPEWKQHHREIKDILATREHVTKKPRVKRR